MLGVTTDIKVNIFFIKVNIYLQLDGLHKQLFQTVLASAARQNEFNSMSVLLI
jgi:hypothetical protein